MQVAQDQMYHGYAFLDGIDFFAELFPNDDEVFEKALLFVEQVRNSSLVEINGKVLKEEGLRKKHFSSISGILLTVIKSDLITKFAKQAQNICSTSMELIERAQFSETATIGNLIHLLERAENSRAYVCVYNANWLCYSTSTINNLKERMYFLLILFYFFPFYICSFSEKLGK